MTADSAPYVGPRPFSAADRDVFFGREGEIGQLVSLVIAHRHLLLYAVSGAGKTSLLRAGLIPALRAEGFEVLPPLRLQAPVPPADARNAYTYAALSRLVIEPDAPRPAEGRGLDPASTLADFLDALERGCDRFGFPHPRLLVLDQLEELFTLYPDRWPEREAFLAEIVEALERDPELRVVLSLREEYVARLERYASVLPEGLRARFHLDRLRAEPALHAVTGPLASREVSFAPGVAEQLIRNLLETRVDLGDGQAVVVEGEFVEPVHLQVVCRSLWESLAADVREVTSDHVAALGSVDESLIRYYDEAVRAAAGRARTGEHALRGAIERSFVTSAGTRATVFAGAEETAHLPATALEELEGRHLIRAEFRAGGRWLELAHDRLIGPLREANARFRARRRGRQLRRAGVVTALLVVALLAALVGAVADISSEPAQEPAAGATGTIATPDLVGARSPYAAQLRLPGSLQLGSVLDEPANGRRPGSVVRQDPRAHSPAVAGTSVTVWIAVGDTRVKVPNVVGRGLTSTERVLSRSGLSLGAVAQASADAIVASQVPAAGNVVQEGTAVEVLLRAAQATRARAPLPDLAVETLGIDIVDDDVVVTVAVSNLAGETAPATIVLALADGLRPARKAVPRLPVGQQKRLEIHLPITPQARGRTIVATVVVDPDNRIRERNDGNNRDVTAPLRIPG